MVAALLVYHQLQLKIELVAHLHWVPKNNFKKKELFPDHSVTADRPPTYLNTTQNVTN